MYRRNILEIVFYPAKKALRKKVYARISIFSFTQWSRNHLCERDGRRSRCLCELTPFQFTLPAVFDVFIRHSQLVP
jgi:hypothetical protein